MDGQRPAWRLSEAVERTNASRSTLRRHLENGRLPNAYKDTSGAWRFPVEDLLAAGVSMLKSDSMNPVSVSTEQPPEQPLSNHAQRIAELEQQLAVERERSAGLERLAAFAHERAEDLRMALRMIEGTRPEQPTEQAQSVPTEQAQDDPVSNPEQPTPSGTRRWLTFGRRR
ncbi:MAG: helix-turn-helix domain-containing protein [Specibacter sp.]